MKPQREIYEKVLDDLKVSSKKCLFIDDRKEYVDGALIVGINGIVYENYEQLIDKLKKFKINI